MHTRTILKTAYRITANHPKLWVFGLFIACGSTFFVLQQTGMLPVFTAQSTLSYTYVFVLLALAGIFTAIGSFAKTMLVLMLQSIARVRRLGDITPTNEPQRTLGDRRTHAETEIEQQNFEPPSESIHYFFRKSKPHGKEAALASLYVLGLFALGTVILVMPFITWMKGSPETGLFAILATILLIGMWYLTATIAFFAICFIVLLGKPYAQALSLATDLITSSGKHLLPLLGSLLIIYACGIGIVGMIAKGGEASFLGSLRAVPWSAILATGKFALCWLLLSVIHVFWHTSMFLAFIQLVKPEEFRAESLASQQAALPEVGHI